MKTIIEFLDPPKPKLPRFLPFILAMLGMLIMIVLIMVSLARAATPATKGYASWYSIASCKKEGTWQKYGGKTASGKELKDDEFTAASWDYPFGTRLLVTNLSNSRSVIVEVTDRGPNKKLYKKGRILDLSPRAFSAIANLSQGVIQIKVERIN